jgi:hypothetical protein
MPSQDYLARVRGAIEQHLAEIHGLFLPGSKITILIRQPDHPDGSRDLVMTDDTLHAAVNALQQRTRLR